MKRCKTCERTLSAKAFSREPRNRDGLKGECRECAASRAREWNRENRERHNANVDAYRKRHPDRRSARNAVYNAIQRGEMARQPCEVCGDADTHAHHDDYMRKLDVRWLCQTHHADADVARRADECPHCDGSGWRWEGNGHGGMAHVRCACGQSWAAAS